MKIVKVGCIMLNMQYPRFEKILNFTEGLIIVVEILSEMRHCPFIQLP